MLQDILRTARTDKSIALDPDQVARGIHEFLLYIANARLGDLSNRPTMLRCSERWLAITIIQTCPV